MGYLGVIGPFCGWGICGQRGRESGREVQMYEDMRGIRMKDVKEEEGGMRCIDWGSSIAFLDGLAREMER